MARKRETEILVVAGREVAISHPDKVLFPKPKYTKLDLVRYYLTVAEGALRGAGGRPNMLVRYPDGIESRALLSEAGAQEPARLDRGSRTALSVGPRGRRGRSA